MNYWKEMYGTTSKEFCEGVIAGIKAFAIWENGEQLVGVDRKPLEEVIKEVREGLGSKEGEEK
jgi:hypothetical protein